MQGSNLQVELGALALYMKDHAGNSKVADLQHGAFISAVIKKEKLVSSYSSKDVHGLWGIIRNI